MSYDEVAAHYAEHTSEWQTWISPHTGHLMGILRDEEGCLYADLTLAQELLKESE